MAETTDKKQIKIEIDVKQATERMEFLEKSIKRVEDRIKNLGKIKTADLSEYQRKQQLRSLGFSVGEWNRLGSEGQNRLAVNLEKERAALVAKHSATTQQLIKLQDRANRELEKSLRNQTAELKKQNAEREKTKKLEDKQLERYAKIVGRNKRKTLEEKTSTVSKRLSQAYASGGNYVQKPSPKQYSEAELADMKIADTVERYKYSVGGYVRGLFDNDLGTSIHARARAMNQKGIWKGIAVNTAGRMASQAMWGIQGAAISMVAGAMKEMATDAPKMEDWLSETQAIAGSAKGTMSELAKSIYEVGSNSRFTTEELTKTTTVLAQAGYSAEDISKLLGSVNSLATATGTDLKTSVDLLTSSMSLWTSQTSDAAQMVDALVVAVNSSKAEISSIQKGMQYAGAAASQMGMSFNETVAAMSAVTNAGLKTRSIMGTGLRAVLTELSDPSKKLQKELDKVGLTLSDVNVRTQGFTNVVKKLSEAGFGAENAFRGMDRQAASFYLALKSQIDLNDQLLDQMDRRGVSDKAEQVRMDTTIAQLGRLKNSWFEIFSTLGGPVNTVFKAVLKEVADGSNDLAEALRSFEDEAQDADAVIERTTAELDSMKTSAKALSEEMWNLAKQNIGENADKANKAHSRLTDRFNSERKVVQGLSQDYKQLKQYMIDISVAREMERQTPIKQRIGAQMFSVSQFDEDLLEALKPSRFDNPNVRGEQINSLLSITGAKLPARITAETMGELFKREVIPALKTMPLEKLQKGIYEFPSGSPVRNSLERLLTPREQIEKDVSSLRTAPSESDLRKNLEAIANIVSSTTDFMGGKSYEQISKRLKDWRGETSQKDITTLLDRIESFRKDLKTLDEMSNKYPDTFSIQAQTSTAKEKLFENIQTLETQITNVATQAMEDIERDLKNESQTNKQGVIDSFMEKLKSMLGTSKSGKSWLDDTIAKLQTAGADEGLIESLKQLREKVISGLIKSAEVAYDKTIKNSELKYGVSDVKQKYDESKQGFSRADETMWNIAYITAQLAAVTESLEKIKSERQTTYSEYSDEQFKALTDPLEEQTVTLKLDKTENEEELARLGGFGATFGDQVDNSMLQAGRDFFNSISQQSAAYSLTLEGLNSVSGGLKTAFKSVAIEGTKVSDAFRSLAQSILQSLANAAINKGVDYLMFAASQALGFTTTGFSGTKSSGTLTTPTREVSTVGFAAGGGFVDAGTIRRYAAGGAIAGRDSVPALLMPGEYVMKKSAVDMIGRETLDAMNQATSRASNDKASNIKESKKPSPVVTNVYVVQDQQSAGMTANDVVVAVGRDILQGGQTRQLIQQVVQGRY